MPAASAAANATTQHPHQQHQPNASISTSTTATAASVAGGNTTATNGGDPSKTESPFELGRRLEATRKELANMIARKKAVDKTLATIETSIYAFETSYLASDQTSNIPQFGNVVKGYDAYVKALGSTSHLAGERRKGLKSSGGGGGGAGIDVKEEDRLFSRSSGTFERALQLKERDTASVSSDADDADEPIVSSSRKRRRM